MGASRGTTTAKYLRVLCTQMAPAFVGVIYWQGCPPAVIPKPHVLIPGVPYHLMHVSSGRIGRQSMVGNKQGGLSCTRSTPILPSGKSFFISMHMYLAMAVLTTLFQWSFAVSSPAVGSDNSSLHWIKFPPAVSRILLGSSFCGR